MVSLTEISSGPSSSSDQRYDVFLSFRGVDTRLAFTDHLRKALVDANIDTFFDDDEIETGEDLKPELEQAIKSSRASIIVMSKNYAFSSWCLDELVLILDLHRTSSHVVIPIFYHVEPSDVRKQQHSFGDALKKHKQRMEAETDAEKRSQLAHKLELWMKALTEVADLKGKDANGRRETVIIEEIVKEIRSILNLHLQSKIPFLIGMDFPITTISSWLKERSSKTADILTIWGMAGIGKTSLAKYIYRLHSHEFERSSFIEDIERRSTRQSSSLLDLQKQLIRDISKRSVLEASDVNVCTTKIEKALLNKQTLVILDGIDSFEQLDVLIGTKGFHPWSKIIITTKDRSLTEKCMLFRATFPPKHTTLALDCLNESESLRLLCWHAFGCNGPKEGYEEEANKVVQYCGGHPLALTILGRSLINEDAATWGDTMEMLKSKEIHNDIEKVLQICFDSLPSENCKELFKHIACFFVGEDREFTETILKECGIRTSSGIKKLIDRCLITIESQKLMMHQLLQEMGRDLVHRESPKKPWKRSRLWNHEESLNLLKEQKGSAKIQGLVLDMKMLEKEPFGGSSSTTENMLQNDLNKTFRAFPTIHRVYDFLSRIWWFFATFFLMLSLSHCKTIELKTDGLGKMDKLNLLQLNHVKLSGSCKKFPNGLRWLCMHGSPWKCIPLDLPMENLVALDMSYSDLKGLWKTPRFLGSLKILNLRSCKLVKVGDFSGLPALERLILARCASLVHVCESIGRCDRLVLLDVSYCRKLTKLPRSIGKLKKVKILSIDGCDVGEFPIEMKNMDSLQVLQANGTIKYLITENCASLVQITFRPEMSTPPRVYYRSSKSLTQVQGIIKFQAIAQIDNEILYSLGWTNLEHVKNLKLQIWDSCIWRKANKLPGMVFYEFGIFSTCFPGKELPNWLAHTTKGSSIAFTMPSSPKNQRIQGLNICFVHTFSGIGKVSSSRTKIRNMTRNRSWVYYAYIFSVQEVDEGIVWLSQWMFTNNEFEDGDEVTVTIVEEEEDCGVLVNECGISPIYNDQDKEEDPLGYYKSWRHIIGGDLSAFELTSGDYFLNHDRFFHPRNQFKELFEHKTSQNLLGYTPQYKKT